MRPAALAGLAALLFAPLAVAAEPTAYRAVVTDAEVKLRAGPSDAFPDTGTLPRGAFVIVEKEEGNGWLAVTAPSGSVSWIAATFVEDPTVRPGVVSMTHGHTDTNPGDLTSGDAEVDALTAMPRASGLAVRISEAHT